MEYTTIVFRIIFFYFFIVLIYRLMGKREVGELGIVDLIVSILIAEMVAICVEEPDKSIFVSVIPIIILVLLEISLSYISLKNEKIRNLLDGSPSVIISNGKINYHEMIKQKYSLDDLLSQIRGQGYKNIMDISYAILENNGTLSVFPKNNNEFPMAVILDGKIQKDTLNEINKSYKYIYKILDNKNILLKDVFYAVYRNNDLAIIRYCDLL